ncbi:MAG: hypothetical protein Q8K36_01125, partial [Alphaproteobacteria bacterium]|nr:hypothetical protein [Alphaproteobacteria bacterium]
MALVALSLVSVPICASSEAAEQSREIAQTEEVASLPFALPRLDLPSLEGTKGNPYLIFHGRDVAAKHLYFGGKTVFISFMNAHFIQNEPRNPDTRCTFGLPFFQKHQIDSIMVGSFEKMWYQTEEMNSLIDIINNIVLSLGYTEIINYGSSMGGFAALAFSKNLSAQKVIAFNPQIDLTKSNAAKGCCKRLNGQFLHTVSEGLCQSSQLYIFY